MPNLHLGYFGLAFLVSGLWLNVLNAQPTSKDPLLVGVVQFSDQEVMDFLHRGGLEIGGIAHLQRDKTRTKLFVTPLVFQRTNSTVFAITTNGVTAQTVPTGATAYFGDDGKVVAWFSNMQAGIYFSCGAYLHLASNGIVMVSSPADVGSSSTKEGGVTLASFVVDPSGSYFGLGSMNGRAYLGATVDPSTVTCVATNFALNKVFLDNGKTYLCGWRESPKKAACLILRKTSEGFIVEREVEFPGINSVVDIDQTGARVILLEDSDSMPSLYVQSLSTGKRVRIGRGRNRALFMESNLF